ncbi:GNAT family N-acetyltransferase [Streptomyces sp. NPDC058231]|uniref:GNAT family N-acetyltransferase n=1 Tax=Streptomyces sp. NPDC058231 TaxID=3346392 RepID=UPI0036E3AE40
MRRNEYVGPVALRAMQSLASRVFPEAGWRHSGDLAWAAACADSAPDTRPTAVWSTGNVTLAWGWLESPGELTIQVDPAHPDLADEVLVWAQQASNSAQVSVTIGAHETHLAAALTAQDFEEDSHSPFFSCLSRPLTNLPPLLTPPDGYQIRAQRDEADIIERAAVHRAVWNSPQITADRHAAMREVWPYRPEFDLTAISPEGKAVAYCQGWYDEVSGVGLFEPVGTAAEYRQLGLSRATGIAVLHAFAAAGGKLATVCPRGDAGYPIPKRVYESLGFQAYSRTHTYSKELRRPR